MSGGLQFTLWSLIIAIGAFHGFFLAAALANRDDNRRANLFFAALLFVISLHLCEYTVAISGLYLKFPQVIAASYPLLFLIGPLFWFYALALLRPSRRMRWPDLVHALPSAICLLALLPLYLQAPQQKLLFLAALAPEGQIEIPTGQYVFMIAHIGQTLIYGMYTLRLIRRGESALKEISSGPDAATLTIVKTYSAVFVGFFITVAILWIGVALLKVYRFELDYVSVVLLTLIIHTLAYVHLKRPVSIEEPPAPATKEKYGAGALSSEHIHTIAERLTAYMEAEKPHLRDDIRLADIANELGVHPHILSQTLNGRFGLNFFDFINSHRVEEAKRLLRSPASQNHTILAIAYESGFSSKATFNRAFKKHAGMTPTMFKKRLSEA